MGYGDENAPEPGEVSLGERGVSLQMFRRCLKIKPNSFARSIRATTDYLVDIPLGCILPQLPKHTSV